jgi:hypothetical protein
LLKSEIVDAMSRCLVPQCELDPPGYHNATWSEFALPKDISSSKFLTVDDPYDSCLAFEAINPEGSCAKSNFNQSATVQCDSYVYDADVFQETVATLLDLVCEAENTKKLIGTVMMLGILVGSLIGGALGDYFGRRRAIGLAILVITPLQIAGGFANSYELYLTLYFFQTTCAPIIWFRNGTADSHKIMFKKLKSYAVFRELNRSESKNLQGHIFS